MTGSLGHFEKVRCLSASGRVLALGGVRAGQASTLTLYDLLAARTLAQIELPTHVLALAADGDLLVAGCGDGQVRFFSIAKASLIDVCPAHGGAVLGIALSGDLLASVGLDGTLCTFARATRRLLARHALSSRPLRAVAVASDGPRVAAAGDDGIVRVLMLADASRREMPGHEGAVRALAFAPRDGRLVSGGEDGSLRVWYLAGAVEAEVRGNDDSGHPGGITALSFLPPCEDDGGDERLGSVGLDGTLRIWRMRARRRPRSFALSGALHASTFVPTSERGLLGRLLVGGDARTIWSLTIDASGDPVGEPVSLGHGLVQLASRLDGGAREEREVAVRTLAALDEPEALSLTLRALSHDPAPEVRAHAARALARHGRSAAHAMLATRLDDPHPEVRGAAFEALMRLGATAPLAWLRPALASREADVRAAALRALTPLAASSPPVRGLIASHLSDGAADVRLTALSELLRLHEPDISAVLRLAYARGAADVRLEVLVRGAAASLLEDPTFSALVAAALDDADAEVRRTAFVLSALTQPALARWLSRRDDAFGRALSDLSVRIVKLEYPSGDSTLEALARAKERLLSPDAPMRDLVEEDRRPLLAALVCRAPDTALRGARGLAVLGDMRALGALLTISREPAPELRREAAQALVTLHDPRARRRLAWMLNDRDPSVRDAAFAGYARLAPGPLALAEAALRAASEDVRMRGLDLLITLRAEGAPAEALLREALEDEAQKVRVRAFQTLWAWHPDDPLTALDGALRARFADVRHEAVLELAHLARGGELRFVAPARERLSPAISDRNLEVAQTAYRALLELRGKGHIETLLAGLNAPHAALRAQAATDAREAGPDALRSTLTKLLEDDALEVRTKALEALEALVRSDAGPLYTGLQSSHLDLRVRAAELLAQRRDERLIEPMRVLLADATLPQRLGPAAASALRQRAATALASLGSMRLLGYFANVLVKDADPVVREQAARGLANASVRGEEAPLLELLGHEELAVRSWAAEGLARLGDVRALPVLTGTLQHPHAPIRIGAVLAFAALGPEGYGGMLQGLEDPSPEVQRLVLAVILARDLRAFRAGEPPELLTSALSSQRPEVRFAAARAIELRIVQEHYLQHLVELLLPERPERAADLAHWPKEEARAQLMVSLAEALAGDRPEQRYAAAQALRLRAYPPDYFRETERAVRPRSLRTPWAPETTPMPIPVLPPGETPQKGPLAYLRRLFSQGTEGSVERAPRETPLDAAEQDRLRMLAFGAYVGLLRQAAADDEAQRVRRDALERIVDLVTSGHVARASALPALARALDDPHHLVRRTAFVSLRRVHRDDPDTPLTLALASSAPDVLRGALDECASRGDATGRRYLIDALNSHVPEARRHAFELLERQAPPGSLEPLLLAIASEHADLRLGVLERLASARDPRVVAALSQALESEHEDLRLRAAELLAERGDERAVPVLASALRAPQEATAERARATLARLGSPVAVQALSTRLAESASERERTALVKALAGCRPSSLLVDALCACFADEHAPLAEAALRALGTLLGPREDDAASLRRERPERDQALLARFCLVAAKSRFVPARLAAAEELSHLADPRGDELASSLFGDRERAVRVAAVESYAARVERFGSPVAPLEAVLRGGARETLLGAALGLAAKGSGLAFKPLLLFVRAGEPEERARALRGLGALGDPRALETLETSARSDDTQGAADPALAAAAIEGLGRLLHHLTELEARERVRELVEAALTRREPRLAVASVRALRWIGGERGRVLLERALREGPPAVGEAAAQALGALGDLRAEAPLARALDAAEARVRFAAYRALAALFPGDRTRYELAAVASTHPDTAEPAADFLASEGDPETLIATLPRLRDPGLRDRLRFGLLRRGALPLEKLVEQLTSTTPRAVHDAAWLIGALAEHVPDAATAEVGETLCATAERCARSHAEALREGAHERADALTEAWTMALWAARRLRAPSLSIVSRDVLALSTAPRAPKEQAAHALTGGGYEDVRALVSALSDVGVERAAGWALGLTPYEGELSLRRPLDPALRARIVHLAPVRARDLGEPLGRAVLGPRLLRTRSVEPLAATARERNPAAQRGAIQLLSLVPTPESAEVLAQLAGDGTLDPDTQQTAYRALRRVKRRLARTPPEVSR